MKKLCVFVLVVLAVVPMAAQISVVRENRVHSQARLSGNLQLDLFEQNGISADSVQSVQLKDLPGYKSPLRAALFSAVIPGAGQTYSERYWHGLAFFGAEVGLWVVYAVYQSKGDKQTNDFQDFADTHYSVVRYAKWIMDNIVQLNPGVNTSGMIVSTDPSLKPWQQVDWNRINAVENEIMQSSTPNGFTHNLPLRPEQQYYELIGKYPQFLGGWDDAAGLGPADVIASNVSPEFLNYRNQRGNANSLYAVASTATYVLVANHVLSALEAAWSAAVNNSNLKMGATLEPVRHSDGIVEFVPTANLRLNF